MIKTVDKSTSAVVEKVDKTTETFDISTFDQDPESFFSVVKSELLPGWYMANDLSGDLKEEIRLFLLRHDDERIDIARSLIVKKDRSWVVNINELRVPLACTALSHIPEYLLISDVSSLLRAVQNYKVCIGNDDGRFVELCELRKGKFLSVKKIVIAFLDATNVARKTVRHVSCEVLVTKDKCNKCIAYRSRLRAMISSFNAHSSKISTNTKANYRYMRTPQSEARRNKLQKKVRNFAKTNLRLKSQLNTLTGKLGVYADKQLQEDMAVAIKINQDQIKDLPRNNFQRIFWEQQASAIGSRSSHSVQYHPLFVRWCINIMLSSPKTYDVIRESGVITLPSKRTLKDYTHWFKPKVGYQMETFLQLYEDYKISELNPAQRQVVLAFDEMKIQEGLVFDNITGNMIGFVDTGEMNTILKEFEASIKGETVTESVATHMLAVCIRGVFMKLEYPLGQFATTAVSGPELYDIVWTAVRCLRQIGLEVVCIVADGISNNRKFFKLHSDSDCIRDGLIYKVKNIYDTSKRIWFMSDICHLMKTTRNCWEKSSKNGTRHLEINGKFILWSHLFDLYEWSREDSGLYIGNKLTLEHVKLTSYSRMNVRLAAQVLSKSVADLFMLFRQSKPCESVYKDTFETERFCRMFNYLFDCLNTQNLYEAEHKRNDALMAYTAQNDSRLQWLENDFLPYLEEWRQYATSKPDISTEDKSKLMLSVQTLEGLKITVFSFIEVVPYLLSLEGANFLLSERFNQDFVEEFFGKQRARCGRNDNPSVNQFLYNTQAIRTTRLMSFGNCSNVRKRKLFTDDSSDLSQPLRKRPKNK